MKKINIARRIFTALIVLFSISTFAQERVAHYTFSGNANDGTTYANDGQVFGATLIDDRFGNANSAYEFDGVDDWILVPQSTSLNTADYVTLSLWLMVSDFLLTDPYGYENYLISHGSWYGRWKASLPADGKTVWTTRVADEDISNMDSDPEVLPLDTWTHVVMVHDGTNNDIYFDGILAATTKRAGSLASGITDGISIGRESTLEEMEIDEYGYYFKGRLDDISIFNYGMTAAEVATLYMEESTEPLSAQKNIMFITNASDFPGPDGEDPLDSKYIEKLRDAGYEVTVITSAQTGADPIPPEVNNAVDACDAIMVTSTISSGAVAYCWPVRYNSIPFLTWESALWDELQLSSDDSRGTNEFAVDSFLTIEPGADTALVGEYTGDVQVVSFAKGTPIFSGCKEEGIAPGAHLVARALGGWGEDVNDEKHVVFYYLLEGDECIVTPDDQNNTSPRLSIAYWFEDATAAHVTDIGWELFLRTVAFLVGDSDTPDAVITRSGIEGVSVSSFHNGSLYLDLKGINRTIDIKIFDISGKLILKKQVQGGDRVSIPMIHFPDGLYIVMGEDFAEKFIKR